MALRRFRLASGFFVALLTRLGSVPSSHRPPSSHPSAFCLCCAHINYYTPRCFCALIMPPERSKSVPIPIHRSASHTPSMMVNAKKYLSDHPQLLDCPRCKAHGETELRFVNGTFTWVCFFVILIAGVLILPLFFLWVPFCIETFKDVEHHCANCKSWVGTYRRLGKST